MLCALAWAAPGGAAIHPANGAPPIGHVWYVMLENSSYAENFGAVAQGDTHAYLAKTLPSQGALLTDYYGVAHISLGNWVAAVSGQPPNFGYASLSVCTIFCAGTQMDCPTFTQFLPGTTEVGGNDWLVNANGVYYGQGCVFPPRVATIADQLEGQDLTWKSYEKGMPAPCAHPPLNQPDPTATATGDVYETGENPLMYFQSVTGGTTCASNDVPLTALAQDLQSVSTTPNFSFIGLTVCSQGHDLCQAEHTPVICPIDPATQARDEGCLAQASDYLAQLIPEIMSSPAYRQDGMIVINWDEASYFQGDQFNDSSSCCNEANELGPSGSANDTRWGVTYGLCDWYVPAFLQNLVEYYIASAVNGPGAPNPVCVTSTNNPGNGGGAQGTGGGNTGAIVLSRFVKPGTTSSAPYNHYSLLRTIEDIFGVPHLGYASDPSPLMQPFGLDVFTNTTAGTGAAPPGRKAVIRTARARLQGDGVVLQVSCSGPRGSACATRLTLEAGSGLVLGRRTVTQKAGGTEHITVYVSGRAMLLVHRKGSVRVRATAAVGARKTHRDVTIRA